MVVRCRSPLHDGLGPGTPITVEWGAETRNGRVMRVDHTAAILSVDAHGDERWLGETVDANSTHHQAVDDTGAFTACARSSDGTIEGMALAGHRFAVGVQWHPELLGDHRLYDALLRA